MPAGSCRVPKRLAGVSAQPGPARSARCASALLNAPFRPRAPPALAAPSWPPQGLAAWRPGGPAQPRSDLGTRYVLPSSGLYRVFACRVVPAEEPQAWGGRGRARAWGESAGPPRPAPPSPLGQRDLAESGAAGVAPRRAKPPASIFNGAAATFGASSAEGAKQGARRRVAVRPASHVAAEPKAAPTHPTTRPA